MTHQGTESDADQHSAGLRRSRLLPWLVAAGVVMAIYLTSPNFRWQPGPDATPYAGDFVHDWLGAYVLEYGERDRFYDVEYAQQLQHDPEVLGYQWNVQKYYPLVYPPFYYPIIRPLAWLPYREAAWIWGLGMVSCLFAAVALLHRHARTVWSDRTDRSNKLVWLPWMLSAALLYMPVVESLSSSQKATVCLLILTATFLLLRADKKLLAGMVFGLMAFKPQLALVIGLAMLWKCQWRFVWGATATLTAFCCLSLSLGTGVCVDYWKFSTGAGKYIQTAGYDLTHSHCLYGFFTLLMRNYELWRAQVATVLIGCVILGLLVRLLRGPLQTNSRRFDLQYAGLVVATVLLSPHLFTYDLSLLLIPIFLIAGEWWSRRPAGGAALAAYAIALYVMPKFSMLVAAQTGTQISVLLLCGLLVALARGLKSCSEPMALATRPVRRDFSIKVGR